MSNRGVRASSFLMTLVFSVLLTLPTPKLTYAQSSLENPQPGAFMSGIGLISGWKCVGGTVTAVFDGVHTLAVPYGSSRTDTMSQCGDANNGFGLLVNYNLLDDGQHTVRLFDNGVQFAEATFTVSTFGGEEFLRGASRTLTTGFGGCLATLRWQESQQNFVIAETDTCFQPLLGEWEFVTKIPGGDEIDNYQLEQIETRIVAGEEIEVITGTDLDHGGLVVTVRANDILDGSAPYDFFSASLSGVGRCEAFLFNQVGPDSVQGIGASYSPDPVIGCQAIPSPLPEYQMTGSKTNAALSEQQWNEGFPQTQVRAREPVTEEVDKALGKLLEAAMDFQLPSNNEP